MQRHYAKTFEREMGCTASELRGWLPGACGHAELMWIGADAVSIKTAGGHVGISWSILPPRRIALLALPRLAVRFEAVDVDDAAWLAFMRRFDLHTQRGGG